MMHVTDAMDLSMRISKRIKVTHDSNAFIHSCTERESHRVGTVAVGKADYPAGDPCLPLRSKQFQGACASRDREPPKRCSR